MTISRPSFNRTIIQDTQGNFFKSIELDSYGNIQRLLYKIKRRPIYTTHVEYNQHNQVQHLTTTDEAGRPSKASYLYTVDGHLDKSWGATNFDFKYDENGNMIMHSRDADREMIIYGPGDRVESYDNKKVVNVLLE